MPISRDEIAKLRRRAEAAYATATSWQSTIKEAYRFTMPERYAIAYQPEGNPIPPTFADIFDSIGMEALDDFAGFVSEALYPFDKEWFQFVPRDDLTEAERREIRARGFNIVKLAEDLTSRVRWLFNRSNFYPAVISANHDLGIGTKFLSAKIDPDDGTRILFTAIPGHVWALDEDEEGRIAGLFRKRRLRAREVEAVFPDGKLSERIKSTARDQPETWIDIEEMIVNVRVSQTWQYVAFEVGDESSVILEQVHRSQPVIASRWSRTPGQVWGVGPTLRCLPDIRTANKVVELVLRNAAIAVTGIWLADDDGVLNPANVRLTPGSIIPKAPGSAGLTPLQAPGRFDVSQMVLEDIRMRINRMHHRVKLPEREMTAWEASERTREAQRELRGAFGQLQTEDVEPVILRVIDLGRQMGVIPQEQIEQMLSLNLIGPLAQAIREDKATRMIGFVRALGGVFGPEIALAAIDRPEFIPRLAEFMGVESRYVLDEDQLRALEQMAAQQAAQMQAEQPPEPPPGGGGGARQGRLRPQQGEAQIR